MSSLTNSVERRGSSRFETSMLYDNHMASKFQTSTIHYNHGICQRTNKCSTITTLSVCTKSINSNEFIEH